MITPILIPFFILFVVVVVCRGGAWKIIIITIEVVVMGRRQKYKC